MLYGGEDGEEGEDQEATEIGAQSFVGNGVVLSGSFAPGATNRTIGTMHSALGKTYSTNTGDKKST
jgi:hypothetical protein